MGSNVPVRNESIAIAKIAVITVRIITSFDFISAVHTSFHHCSDLLREDTQEGDRWPASKASKVFFRFWHPGKDELRGRQYNFSRHYIYVMFKK